MKNSNTYMDLEGTLHFIENVHKLMEVYGSDKYNISYFGGEPLMNWGLIEKSAPLFKQDPRCEHQIIISNGLLLDENKINFIKENEIGFSFSFDGLWQNKNRPHVSHEDVFSLYMKKIPLVKKLVGNGGGKVMVSPSNIDTMTENFEFFVNEIGAYFPDFSLVRDDIWSEDDVKRFKVESRRLADRIVKYYEDGKAVFVGFFGLHLIDSILGYNKGKRPFGCFAGCSGVGYMPDKQFYLCARYGSGDSDKSGLIMDVNGNLNHDLINKYLDPNIHNPKCYEECKACDLYKFCNAGCTYSQTREDEQGNITAKPVKNVCELYHIIQDDVFYLHDKLKDNKLYIDCMVNRYGKYF